MLVLGTPRATANGTALALGWVVTLAAATVVVVVLTGEADDPTSDASAVVSWLKVGLGVALLLLALKKWRGRPRAGDEAEVPGWMAKLDEVHPPRAFLYGALLAGANVKNLALTFAAASSIAYFGLAGAEAAIAGGIYVVLGSSTVLAALAAHLIGGAPGAAALTKVKEFTMANNAVIMMAILLVLGASVLGDGLAGL